MGVRTRAAAALVASCAVVAGLVVAAPSAGAEPTVTPPREVRSADGAHILSESRTSPTRTRLLVASPAMGKPIRVEVLTPRRASGPRPTMYMLDGIDAGVLTGYRESGWTTQTDLVRFVADKNVNVVLPIGGMASYYTDWLRRDPVLGKNMWETFLTRELPPLIDARFDGNGRNGIEGVSMGATAAMSLAVRNPELYRTVVSLSGCLDLSDRSAADVTRASVFSRGGNPDNMWGPSGTDIWKDHDPTTHVSALKDHSVYVAVGDGLPDLRLGLAGIASPVGGVLEAGARACSRGFLAAARKADVSVQLNYRPGLHSWGYWAQDLHRSWPMVATALDID